METVLELLKAVVETYQALLPSWAVALILVVGTLRVAVKPVMEFAKKLVAITPSEKDDVVVSKVEASKTMKIVLFVLDWLASIKIEKK